MNTNQQESMSDEPPTIEAQLAAARAELARIRTLAGEWYQDPRYRGLCDAILGGAPPREHPATFASLLLCPTCMQAVRYQSPAVDAVMRSIEEYRNAPSNTAGVPIRRGDGMEQR